MTIIRTSSDYELVLAPRTRLVPVQRMSKATRTMLGAAPDDYAIFRPESRSTAKLVGPDVFLFLRAFAAPVSIKLALLAFARVTGGNAERLLERMFPIINDMLQAGFLMPREEAELARRSRGSALRMFGDYTIVRRLQRMDDVEVYCARTAKGALIALKIAAKGHGRAEAALAHEAGLLRHLDGVSAPRYRASGTIGGRSYLAMEWVQGIAADRAADAIRGEGGSLQASKLLRLAAQIAAAYAGLHEAGVIHCDVHPNNVLVSATSVRIVDFGLSSLRGQGQRPRSGVGIFFEPEFAQAALKKKARPAATLLGEQYCVAVLLFRVLAGGWYLPFTIDRETAFRQIVSLPPQRFAELGVVSDNALEAILARALEKKPASRFPSMSALAQALARHSERPADPRHGLRQSQKTLEDFVSSEMDGLLARGAEFVLDQPLRVAVNMGLAGVAYGAYRVAVNRRSADMLAFADEVAERAASMQHDDDALFSEFLGLTNQIIPKQCCFNGAAGVSFVRCLIAHARQDARTATKRLHEFLDQSAGIEDAGPDYTFGQAGTLIACANLLPVVKWHQMPGLEALRRFGDLVETALLASVTRMVADSPNGGIHGKTGAAHGMAGYLFALLQWRWLTGQAVTGEVCNLLRQFANLGIPVDRGIAWPHTIPFAKPKFHGGWCNGAAGLVQLWLAAFRATQDPHWLDTAECGAWSVWDAEDAGWDLCCGRAGRAYALLEFAAATGKEEWLVRATAFAVRAVAEMRLTPAEYVGLYRGAIGVIVMASDVTVGRPRSMPFYGEEP